MVGSSMAAGTNDDVDIEALRSKYSQPRDELRANEANLPPPSAPKMKVPELKHPIIMCQACQAHGTIKKQYGFRVLDEQCDTCKGEGIIVQKPKPASEELQEKVAAVEAMIGEVDSLEELERLEGALKARTLEALDLVLSPVLV